MLFLQDYFHDKKHRFCAKKKELILSEKLLKNLLFSAALLYLVAQLAY